MHPPVEPDDDDTAFAVTLGALLRGVKRAGVELQEPQSVAGVRGGYDWTGRDLSGRERIAGRRCQSNLTRHEHGRAQYANG